MTLQGFALLFAIFLVCFTGRFLPLPQARQWLLLLASYLFYITWGGKGFLLVLIASSVANYVWGWVLRRRPTAPYLWIGVALNVLLLAFFKYLPPLAQQWPGASWEVDFFERIIMPLGISFWTFQGLSYLFDIYREEELDASLVEFCLYMAFWPTVLSGPICRLPKMLPQFRRPSASVRDDISVGTVRLIQGLFMKLVLAQMLSSGLTPDGGVTAGFDAIAAGWSGLDVWLLAVGFGFQLFFDFAGYSHMVIGAARLFGIRLEENFDRPYLSITPSVFWTRWHMSLSFWIRDYVFLPLATVRRDYWWPYAALVISMAVFGLWHGAKATFILWGLYHGLLLVTHRLGQQIKRQLPFAWPSFIGTCLSWGTTFSLVSLGWIFFRARDLDQAVIMLQTVFSLGSYGQLAQPTAFYILTLSVVIGYFVYEAMKSLFAFCEARYEKELEDNVQAPARMRFRGSLASLMVIALELVDFFGNRLWWWLTPMVLMSLVLVGVIIPKISAVSPFIYTLF
jgi:alginate O-acetyltransferase complex protein AlgI